MHLFFTHMSKNLQLLFVLTHMYLCKYKNTTFVNILLIHSPYNPGKPFLKGALFFNNPSSSSEDTTSDEEVEQKPPKRKSAAAPAENIKQDKLTGKTDGGKKKKTGKK